MSIDAKRVTTILSGSPLFAGVPSHVMEAALGQMELLEFAAGQPVLREGASTRAGDDSALYVLVDGQLAASRSLVGGRTQPLSTIAPGDFFGELARVEEGVRSATVSAVTPVIVARMPGPAADRLIADAPIVMRTIAAAIARRLRAADEARITARLNEERLGLIGKAAAMLVHDLKDPLGRVLNAADCIDQGIGAPATWTGQSRRAAEFMLAMVKDLTAYAKGERSYLREPVKIASVIEDVESFGLRPLESNGRVKIERQVNSEGVFTGDQRAMSRALLNIVKNAGEEMSTAGGTLRFEAGIVDGKSVRFAVSDTGRGIPEDILPTVFEPFATFGKKSGTGLGMAMTKAAIDAHNGDIRIASRPGAGTTFTVMIPV